jgi:formate hydrogenlyase subunit 4
MNEFEWNYVWYALAINFVIVYAVPRLIKKPTKIKIIDDIVLYLNTQQSFLLSSSIILALVVYGSHYWMQSEGKEVGTSKTPDF